MLKNVVITIALTLTLTACAGMTRTKEIKEGYYIYDIKGISNHSVIAGNLKIAMQENADKVSFKNYIPPNPLPKKPGRYKITNPLKALKNSGAMGALIAASAKSVAVPSCDKAIITAISHDKFAGAEKVTFFLCLMPYTKGYHLDVYYSYTAMTGGFRGQDLIKSAVDSMFGDSSKYIPKTIAALELAVKKSGGTISVVESYP